MKNNNLLTFLRRYAMLHVALIIAVLLVVIPQPFGLLGTLVYLPVLSLGAVCTVLGVRHVFLRNTLDEDAHSGFFIRTWREELTPVQRVQWSLITTIGLFLGVCHIAAALIR